MLMITLFIVLTPVYMEQLGSTTGQCRIQEPGCPQQWSEHNGHCYRFFTHRSPWYEGKLRCQAKGADYVDVRDKKENEFITGNVSAGDYWIAGTDVREERQWIWAVTPVRLMNVHDKQYGKPFTAWSNGEPSTGHDQDCAILKVRANNTGKWYARTCADKYSYICKKPKAKVPKCPQWWTEHNGHCYRPFPIPVPWYEGKLICQAKGADYVDVRDKMENDFIKGGVSAGDYWIAGADVLEERNWIWAVTPVRSMDVPRRQYEQPFAAWSADEPSKGFDQACAIIKVKADGTGQWYAKNCTEKYPYICKKPKDPEWKLCLFQCVKLNKNQTGLQQMPWTFTTQQFNSQATALNISVPKEMQISCFLLEDSGQYKVCLNQMPAEHIAIFSDTTNTVIPMPSTWNIHSTGNKTFKDIRPCFVYPKTVTQTVTSRPTVARTDTTSTRTSGNQKEYIAAEPTKTILVGAILGVLNVILLVALIGTILYCRKRNSTVDKPVEQKRQFDNPAYVVPDEWNSADRQTDVPKADTKHNFANTHMSQTAVNTGKNSTNDVQNDTIYSQMYAKIPRKVQHPMHKGNGLPKKDVNDEAATNSITYDSTEMVQNELYDSNIQNDDTEIVQNELYASNASEDGSETLHNEIYDSNYNHANHQEN